MPEQETPAAKNILTLKNTIHAHWRQLPPEHQATTMLVLMRQALAGKWGGWLRDALALLDQSTSEPDTEASDSPLLAKVTLTREDINQLPLTDTEKAKLTDADIRRIERNVELNLYAMIWDEIEAVTFAEMDAKDQKR